MWKERIRILVVEDNPDDAELTSLALAAVKEPKVDVIHAYDLKSAVRRLGESSFDTVLLDLSLPDSDGMATLERIRECSNRVPIIVLTGLSDTATALLSLDHGAQDYLLKNAATSEVLLRAARYAIQRQQMVLALVAANELLEKKNLHLAKLHETAHRFVDNVSHEFRTPLTVIKEYTALMREGLLGPLSAEQQQVLDIVGDRAEDLNTMVDDMLDSSRLEAGMLGMRRESCQVTTIIDNVRQSLQRKAAVKKVTLEIKIEDDLPDVFCDAHKAERVIVNLAINAMKFCKEPGFVTIFARRMESSNDIVIGVTDNGPGVDEQFRRTIFRRFTQLDTETKDSTKGFGLGLSIARELVDLNFGEMDLKSENGDGSTFSFTLPIAIPSEIVQRYVARIASCRDGVRSIAIVRVGIAASSDPAQADDADSFLSYVLRSNDLHLRLDTARWLLLFNVSELELPSTLGRVATALGDLNRNRINGRLPEVRCESLGVFQATNHQAELTELVQRELENIGEGECVIPISSY
jgi:signal transduction histidine kinase